jgi:D-alanine-D-alanine ligase
MRIAVVRNLSSAGVSIGHGEPRREAVPEAVADALRDEGHRVAMCEGDGRMLDRLEAFAPGAAGGSVTGMVFNLARGVQGDAPRAHVPAMLEMAGIPFTGPSPLGHALTFDGLAWRALLTQAGIPTTRYAVMRWPGDETAPLRFPLRVAARLADAESAPRLASARHELGDVVEEVLAGGAQEVLVEEYAENGEISAALLGNTGELELLPLLGHEPGEAEGPSRLASLPALLAMRVGAVATAAFKACHCLDYARIVVRLDRTGRPLVVGVDSMPALGPDADFVRAAVARGYGYADLIGRVLDTAHRRYFGVPAPRFEISGPNLLEDIPSNRAGQSH